MLNDHLQRIFTHSQKLIVFAEAKNGGLAAFNVVLILFVIHQWTIVNVWITYWLIYVLVLNGISLATCLSAMVAQPRAKELDKDASPDSNYLFYDTIARFGPDEFLSRFTAKYELRVETAALSRDMARQIIIVSQIATRKFTYFNRALMLTIMALFTPLGYLIYYFNRHGS